MVLSSAVTAVQAVSRVAASAWLSRQVSTSPAHVEVARTDKPIDSKEARSICETLQGMTSCRERGHRVHCWSGEGCGQARFPGAKALDFGRFCSRNRVAVSRN